MNKPCWNGVVRLGMNQSYSVTMVVEVKDWHGSNMSEIKHQMMKEACKFLHAPILLSHIEHRHGPSKTVMVVEGLYKGELKAPIMKCQSCGRGENGKHAEGCEWAKGGKGAAKQH